MLAWQPALLSSLLLTTVPLTRQLHDAELKAKHSGWFLECDSTQSPIKYRILKELEALEKERKKKEDHADSASTTPAAPETSNVTEIGPLRLRLVKKKDGPTDSTQYSWTDAAADLEDIQSSRPSIDWPKTDTFIRALLVDDIDRLTGYKNRFLRPKDLKALASILAKAKKCGRERCELPSLSDEEIRLLEDNPIYSPIWKGIEARQDGHVKGLVDRLDYDLSGLVPWKEPTVRRVSRSQLELSVWAPKLAPFRRKLDSLFEAAWSSPRLGAKLRWLDAAPAKDEPALRIVAVEDPGFRSYYDPQDRTLRIAQLAPTRDLMHELGHALGLPDRYVTYFDPGNCSYTEYFENPDIMADPDTADPSDQDWKDLDTLYPFQPAEK